MIPKEFDQMVPTDTQIDAPVHDCLGDDGFDVRAVVRAALERWGCPAPAPADCTLSPEQSCLNQQALEMLDSFACSMETLGMDTDIFYRALRSSPAQAPAEGEVAELALNELERIVVLLMPVTGHKKIKRFDTIRAALKRLQKLENKDYLSPAPVPVAVSERLPEVENCAPWPEEPDATHWCWFGSDADGAWAWEQHSAGEHTYHHRSYTHWLPATALPLPSAEVE